MTRDGILNMSDARKFFIIMCSNSPSICCCRNIKVDVPSATWKLRIVDPMSAQAASASGIRDDVATGTKITMQPFAIVVATMQ